MGSDILLYNSRTPRYRSLSDNIIENGLSILKEHLGKHGLEAKIEDQGTIEHYESFSPKALTKPINSLYGKILDDAANGKNPSKLVTVPAVALQKVLDKVQNKRMEKYLTDLAEEVVQEDIPVVGNKVWYGDSFKWSQEFHTILENIAPEVIRIDGGPHPSVYQDDFVQETNADLVVLSEGEDALTSIVSMVKDLKSEGLGKDEILDAIKQADIPNLAYKDGDDVVKNSIKNTPLDQKTIQKYQKSSDRIQIGIINDALGCPYNSCNFCDYRNIYPKYLVKDPNIIVDEMESFLQDGVGLFRFTSGSNSLDDSVKIAEEILERELEVNYSFFNRCEPGIKNDFENVVEKYEKLIESGLRAVFIGAESGNEKVLSDIINKGASREDIIYNVKAIREASKKADQHVDISLSVIYPHPVMDGISLEESYNDTLSLIKETMPDSVLPNPPAPFSGSEWLKNEKFGFDYFNPDKPETANLDREDKKHLIASEMMNMDYLLYLPPKMWDLPNILLNGNDSHTLIEMNSKLRKDIGNLGIPTDFTDDYFLIMRAAGYDTTQDITDFKNQSMQSIISCDYDFIKEVYNKTNQKSLELAKGNFQNGT